MAWDSGTYRRDASKANRGKPFEDFINFANEKYQAKGIAVMHKVPTEFIPLRGAHGKRLTQLPAHLLHRTEAEQPQTVLRSTRPELAAPSGA